MDHFDTIRITIFLLFFGAAVKASYDSGQLLKREIAIFSTRPLKILAVLVWMGGVAFLSIASSVLFLQPGSEGMDWIIVARLYLIYGILSATAIFFGIRKESQRKAAK